MKQECPLFLLKPNKIVPAKGKRNIGANTSGERATNVTLVLYLLMEIQYLLFVFPRNQFKSYFLNGGPPECIGA